MGVIMADVVVVQVAMAVAATSPAAEKARRARVPHSNLVGIKVEQRLLMLVASQRRGEVANRRRLPKGTR